MLLLPSETPPDSGGASSSSSLQLNEVVVVAPSLPTFDFVQQSKKPKGADERWFIVDRDWFLKAVAHAKDPLSHALPPQFSVAHLVLADSRVLKPNLVRGIEFEIIPEALYNYLHAQYGPFPHPPLETRSTAFGTFDYNFLSIQVFFTNDKGDFSNDNSQMKRFSFETTQQRIYDELCKPLNARLWIKMDDYAEFKHVDLNDAHCSSLRELHWQSNKTQLLVEPPPFAKSIKGDKKLGSSLSSFASGSNTFGLKTGAPSMAVTTGTSATPATTPVNLPRGVVGLKNLGNTCYLNVVLQALLHTQPLTAQFISHVATKLVNHDNALGQRGEAVKALTALFCDVWSPRRANSVSSTSPARFKQSLDQWTNLFREFKQHDAQEAMLYILDALHEDTLRPDKTSLTSNIFGGQLSVNLSCPSCKHASPTLESFFMLSLELPATNPTVGVETISLPFFPLDSTLSAQRIQVKTTSPARVSPEEVTKVTGCPVVLVRIRKKAMEANDLRVDIKEKDANILPPMAAWELVAYERVVGNCLFHLVHRQNNKIVGCPQVISGNAYTHRDLRLLVEENCPSGFSKLSIARMGTPAASSSLLGGGSREMSLSDEPFRQSMDGMVVIADWPDDDSTRVPSREIPALNGSLTTGVGLSQQVGVEEGAPSLQSCLNHFFAPEVLDQDNLWMCPTCNQLTAATRSAQCTSVPAWLVLHLKRFKSDGSKIRDLVRYDEHVQFGDKAFQLQSVIRHHGLLASSGHYTALVKSNMDLQWRTFNDELVSAPLSRAPLNEPDAFIFVLKQA